MFRHGTCQKIMEKPSDGTYVDRSNLHSNVPRAWHICSVLEPTAHNGSQPACSSPHFNASGKTRNANHTVDLLREGSFAHAAEMMAFALKSLDRTVNRIPMLAIRVHCVEPPSTFLAIRASHHLNEALSNFKLLVASASIGHDPCLSGALNVTLVNLPHLLHRKSVDVQENLPLFHPDVPDLSIKPLALCGWIAMLADFDPSPKNIITDLWRLFRAQVCERPELGGHPSLHLLRCGCNRGGSFVFAKSGVGWSAGRGRGRPVIWKRKIFRIHLGRRWNANSIISILSFSLATKATHRHGLTCGDCRNGVGLGLGGGGVRRGRRRHRGRKDARYLHWRSFIRNESALLRTVSRAAAQLAQVPSIRARPLRVRALQSALNNTSLLVLGAKGGALCVHGSQWSGTAKETGTALKNQNDSTKLYEAMDRTGGMEDT